MQEIDIQSYSVLAHKHHLLLIVDNTFLTPYFQQPLELGADIQLQIPIFAVSLGAVESILSYPAQMSHAAIPKEEREKRGITDGLLRLSVGLENVDDLIADLDQALQASSQVVKKCVI